MKAADRYREGNLLAATIVASDPVKYQGGLAAWADTVLSREAEADEANVGPLFGRSAA